MDKKTCHECEKCIAKREYLRNYLAKKREDDEWRKDEMRRSTECMKKRIAAERAANPYSGRFKSPLVFSRVNREKRYTGDFKLIFLDRRARDESVELKINYLPAKVVEGAGTPKVIDVKGFEISPSIITINIDAYCDSSVKIDYELKPWVPRTKKKNPIENLD